MINYLASAAHLRNSVVRAVKKFKSTVTPEVNFARPARSMSGRAKISDAVEPSMHL
jgi:hypothetical protein